MKKKILSLLVAGVVALGTAMPASADVFTGNAGQTEMNTSVTVTGTVNKSDNSAPAGRIQVEMPTTMAFTVYANGDFHAAPFTIENKGDQTIEVSVDSFRETKPGAGITLLDNADSLTSKSRDNIHLTLKGDDGEVTLKSSGTATTKLATIEKGRSSIIQLNGKAGTSGSGDVEQNGVDEDFNLVFKIKKNA